MGLLELQPPPIHPDKHRHEPSQLRTKIVWPSPLVPGWQASKIQHTSTIPASLEPERGARSWLVGFASLLVPIKHRSKPNSKFPPLFEERAWITISHSAAPTLVRSPAHHSLAELSPYWDGKSDGKHDCWTLFRIRGNIFPGTLEHQYLWLRN